MGWSKSERFEEFLKRLQDAPAASSHDEAFTLLNETLNKVEDELSGVPFQPDSWQTDGRMYPPGRDHVRSVDNRADLIRYRNRGHNTFIRDNGAIEIQDVF